MPIISMMIVKITFFIFSSCLITYEFYSIISSENQLHGLGLQQLAWR